MKYRRYAEPIEAFIKSIYRLHRYTTISIARATAVKFGTPVRPDDITGIVRGDGIETLPAGKRGQIWAQEKRRPDYGKEWFYPNLKREMEDALRELQ